MTEAYNHKSIESEAQLFWDSHDSYKAQPDSSKPKYYVLSMFPYPSGKLHMGHVRNYVLSDVVARFKKMQGANVLHPIGFDAFGLPAENAAIKHGVSPYDWTESNMASMLEQFKQLGLSFDWGRSLATCHPSYYRWEQWLFLKMYEKGLVYRKKSVVNWDPVDNTVLANEQVVDGRGWRSGALVEKREIMQWFIKITDYASELLDSLDTLKGWPEQVVTMQKNWIGKSVGAEVTFKVTKPEFKDIDVFTTRPDTIYGVSYIALSTQHPIVKEILKTDPKVKSFVEKFAVGGVSEAEMATMEKEGYYLGVDCINPINGKNIPLYVANYVLNDYGTGAVMGVPAHDARDYDFATKYDLPVIRVIESDTDLPFTGSGNLVNSDEFTGIDNKTAANSIIQKLSKLESGGAKEVFRLRDWGVSRQRYWGTPIPMIYCKDCGTVPVPEKDLPVVLPTKGIEITGGTSPLANDPSFYEVACPKCGMLAKRETDTFDTFVESSWYYLRYCCVNDDTAMVNEEANYWSPVDQYVGGIEHACMHLLYARFIHKVIRDLGLINSDEPFTNLLTQGMVLKDGAKMSKSKGNTVDPGELIEKYGADTMRLFILFAAPPEQSLEWSDSGVDGAYRFLKRLYSKSFEVLNFNSNYQNLDFSKFNDQQKAMVVLLNKTISKVSDDFGRRLMFNTAIASCMELLNSIYKYEIKDATDEAIVRHCVETLILLLCPIIPHLAHNLWIKFGYKDSVVEASWPLFDETKLQSDTVQVVVQINGKLRGRITTNLDTKESDVMSQALLIPAVQSLVDGKEFKKVIFVPNKLLNIVV